MDEFYHTHYQHITNTISDGRSVRRNEFLAYNLEMYWQKTHTWKWKYRKHRLNMKQLDESQKAQKIIFINTSKKIIELQKTKPRCIWMKVPTFFSSIEVTFIVLWDPNTNLETYPNSVTKMVIKPKWSCQILTNLRWHICHEFYTNKESRWWWVCLIKMVNKSSGNQAR